MSSIEIGEITAGYDDKGSGPALVLVHGHPFDRSMWEPQLDHFSARGWRVVAPDLRGYGETTVVPGKTPLATFARDLAALLDRLTVDRFVLAGLSMGGQIVMECHRLFPDRIRGLVLADTSPRAETAAGRRNRTEMADRLLREGLRPYADEVLTKMVAPANVEAMPDVAEHVHRMMRGTSPEGAAAALRGRAERPDYVPTLAGVGVPTLVVVGDQDEYTPVAEAEFLHASVPGSELAVIAGAAHLPNLERTAEFDAVLADFLARLPQES
ncbi:alpha/beta fold hydrolase [Amycolatopsis viridis]|uniref:Pimeloyl-ACP methyl ester carboxylesterase n=1 Tax=Amycolatopsis viridis TaxID=185678 RepID=A0ABX0SNA6_9PSEU|nr:alpha/beta fold hydrolase [Amycolatopsis viridis]NIH78398.1 pimeloyl-ACP methyl ester carboxylesterase [Amycolatopsis viridis]